MPQEILRTEDVVECLDSRIQASSDHVEFSVQAGETYGRREPTDDPAILDKFLSQSCSEDQKYAINAAVSLPSSLNPVVLKEAIEDYYQQVDLGEFKDSVMTYAELILLTGNEVGDLRPVIDEQQIYRWDGTTWVLFIKTGTLDHTQLTNQNVSTAYNHITLADKSLSTSLANTHEHQNDPDLTKTFLTGDSPYLESGYKDPDLLLKAIETSGSGIILSTTERLLIPSATQKEALNGAALIFAAASVDPITDTITKDNTLTEGFKGKFLSTGTLPSGLSTVFYYAKNVSPTSFQVSLTLGGSAIDLLTPGTGVHSFGSNLPSVANRYVTSVDPRLNTIKNPYITFGLPGSDSTFECSQIQDLMDALDFIASPEALGLKAIEVLPSTSIWEWAETVVIGKTLFDLSYTLGAENAYVHQVLYNDMPMFEHIDYAKVTAKTVSATPSNLTAGIKHYIQTVNGIVYDFTSDATPTASKVVAGLKALMSSDLAVTVSGKTSLVMISKIPGESFTYSGNANLTDVLISENAGNKILFYETVPAGVRIVVREKKAFPLTSGTVTWTTREIPNTAVWPINTYSNEFPAATPGNPIFSSSEDDSFLIEALASRESFWIFSPNDVGATAFTITGDYPGVGFVRSISFVLGGVDALCALLNRPGTIFEDCAFLTLGSMTSSEALQAIKITADRCHIIRCIFGGVYTLGMEISGNDCVVDGCSFTMLDASYPALKISGDGCRVFGCTFYRGKIVIDSEVEDVILDRNALTEGETSVEDNGINTRWLNSLSQDLQQAFIGRTRTVGNASSYADFKGASEEPFITAFNDPYTDEIVVFEGSYVFSNPVTVPPGKKVRAIRKGQSIISGGKCFILSDFSCLSGLTLNTNGDVSIFTSGTNEATVTDCVISNSTHSCIWAESTTNLKVEGCSLSGFSGIYLDTSERAKILKNKFGSTVSIETEAATHLYYADNLEYGSSQDIGASDSLIYGNHFLNGVPSKLRTSNSLWRGNYPMDANNTNGIDVIELPIGDLLSPLVQTGAYRGTFLGTAAIAFIETGMPTAVTLPMHIGAKVNRTGYTVRLNWISTLFSGVVKWQVAVSFRDRINQEVSTAAVRTSVSTRNPHLSGRDEESVLFTFTDADFGLDKDGFPLLDISHVSLTIKRLGDDSLDTLAGIAYLTNVITTIPRD